MIFKGRTGRVIETIAGENRTSPRARYLILSLDLPQKLREVAARLLTKQQELDVLGRLDTILLEILLDLLAAGQSGPLLRGHGAAHLATRCLHKRHPHALLLSPAEQQQQRGQGAAPSPARR